MRQRRLEFGFLCIGHMADHLAMLIFPTAVLALAPVWQRGYDELIALGTVGFATFALGTYPAGWLADRWSRTGMMKLYFLGLGAALVATGFARDPLELAIGLGAIGLFAAIYHPVGIAHLVEITDRSGRALGINGVFGNMGIAGAAITAGGLASAFGWQAAFIGPGLVVLLVGVAYLFLAGGEVRGAVVAEEAADTTVAPGTQRRVFVFLVLSALFSGVVFHGITVVMPALFAERLSLEDPKTVGAIVSGITAIAAFIQIVTGGLMDDRRVKPLLICLTAGQVVFFILIAGASGVLAAALTLPLLFLVCGEIPAGDWLVARYTTRAARARVYAVMYVLSLGVSIAAVPLIAWFHGTAMGFAGLLLLFAGLVGVVMAAAFLLPGSAFGRRSPAPAPAAAE
jgi:MFS family permease